MKRLTIIPLTVLAVTPFTSVTAQEQPPPVEPGARVRVTAPDLGINRQVATFDALESGVLIVTADSTMRCPLSDVTRLDVHKGRESHLWFGAGLGFVTGALVGATWGTSGGSDCGDLDQLNCQLFGAAILAAPGALIGGLVGGFLWKTDRWEEVPLDRLRVSFVPQRNGRFALGLSMRF